MANRKPVEQIISNQRQNLDFTTPTLITLTGIVIVDGPLKVSREPYTFIADFAIKKRRVCGTEPIRSQCTLSLPSKNIRKLYGFLTFSGGSEKVHWEQLV